MEDSYTLELLKELKAQSKRWFIACIILGVIFCVVSLVNVYARMQFDYRLDMVEQEITEHRAASQTYFEAITDYMAEKENEE